MKNRGKRIAASVLILALVLSGGCGAKESAGSSAASKTAGVDAAVTDEMINIKKSDYETDWESESYITVTADGSSASADGAGVSTSNGRILIAKEGTYVLSGTFDGTVSVDTGSKDAKVRLVLNGFAITSSDGPAIYAGTADKVTITTAKGTENHVADSAVHSDEDADAAIYSKADLVLNGEGTLLVDGAFKDAVHSTDDLRITGGTYTVTGTDDGFVGKDRLEITDGTFTVTTTSDHGDAFKSTNTEDEDKGFIYVSGGSYTITSGDEAFQSARNLMVTGGTFTISAGGKGFHVDDTLEFDGGDVAIKTSYEGLEAPVITINGGTFDITATDDGINAAGGDLDASSDSSADNAENEFGTGDGPGNRARGGMMSTSSGYLYINGGTIHIDASGDGIDANTSITQTGGAVTIDGPTADMDGALDYDDTYDISGGSVFAAGSAGMLQTVSESSALNCLAVIYTNTQPAGTRIVIRDADNNAVAEYTPSKAYRSFVFASGDLRDKETYTVYSGDTKLCSVTLSGTVTMVDDSGNAAEVGMRGGFGGFRGRWR